MDVTNFLDPKMYKKIELLPPEALKYLLKQVESMPEDHPEKQKMLRIADIATKTLIKQGELEAPEKRKFNLKRYFYLPFGRILFDADIDQRQVGRISRHSMENIWNYLESQLMSQEIDELELSFNVAVRKKAMKKAKIIVTEFNRLAGQKLEEVIEKYKDDEKEWSRFSAAIGSRLIAREAEELAYYLQNIEEVEKAHKAFTIEIPDLSGKVLAKITNEVMKIKEQQPKMFPFYITLLIDTLKHPSHILRVIQKYYRIDDASAAAKCDLSLLGEILIFNAKVSLSNFTASENNQKNHEQHLEHYLNYAKIILGLEREFDVSPISSWGKDIINMKTQAADALEGDILACPKLLTSVLGRYQKISDGKPIKAPNQLEIDELNSSIYLLHGIKLHIQAASCHVAFSESYRKCKEFIDVFSEAIVELIRRENVENKKTLLAYLQISTDLIRIIKDPAQAELYYKGGQLAVQAGEE